MSIIQETTSKNIEASIKNIEMKIGQLFIVSSITQFEWGFGGNTVDNLKNESCNPTELRSIMVPSILNASGERK